MVESFFARLYLWWYSPGRIDDPWSIETTPVGVTTTEVVSTREGDNLLVIVPHPVEDMSQVVGTQRSIRQSITNVSTVRIGMRFILVVLSAGFPRDLGPLHFFKRGDTGKSPQVGVADPRVGGLDRDEEFNGVDETGVGGIVTFLAESHTSTVASSIVLYQAECTTGVPCESIKK